MSTTKSDTEQVKRVSCYEYSQTSVVMLSTAYAMILCTEPSEYLTL